MSKKPINISDRIDRVEHRLFLAIRALCKIVEIDNSPELLCKKMAIKALEEIRNFGKDIP